MRQSSPRHPPKYHVEAQKRDFFYTLASTTGRNLGPTVCLHRKVGKTQQALQRDDQPFKLI